MPPSRTRLIAGAAGYKSELRDAYRGLRLDPGHAGMYYRRIGAALRGLGDDERAIQAFTSALEFDPGDAQALYGRGVCYSEAGDFARAIADFDRALELDPGWGWAFTERGRVYLKTKAYDQAIADFTAAIGSQPDYAVPYYLRGLAYRGLGRHAEAAAGWEHAARLNPHLRRPRPLFQGLRQRLRRLFGR